MSYLIRILYGCLLGVKPLSESMLTNFKTDSVEKFEKEELE